jgi:hypothetical protein
MLPQLDNANPKKIMPKNRIDIFISEYIEPNSHFPDLKNTRVSPPVYILRV